MGFIRGWFDEKGIVVVCFNMRATYTYMSKYDEAITIDNKMIKLRPKESWFLF